MTKSHFAEPTGGIRSFAARASASRRLRTLYASAKALPIVGALARHAVSRLVPRGRRVWLKPRTGLAQGLWLDVDPRYDPDYMDGSGESMVQKTIAERLCAGGTFYDVGAHIGFFSLIAARLVGELGAVFAFEADRSNAARIEQQVLRNRFNQITVLPVAVWSESGIVHFQRDSDFSGRYSGSVAGTFVRTGARESVEVEALTLDAFSESHRAPTLVKIDVEGGEIDVLRGAARLLAATRPVVVCEVHIRENAPWVEAYFADRSYSVQWLTSEYGMERHLLALPACDPADPAHAGDSPTGQHSSVVQRSRTI
jgi:FkbM family methyltransferase